MVDHPQATLLELPLEVLQMILKKQDPESRLHASRACRCLRAASCACEWRVRLKLPGARGADALLTDFVGWAGGGLAQPRNVTRLTLCNLEPRRRSGPAAQPLTSVGALSSITTLASLNLTVDDPASLTGLSLCTALTELRLAVPSSDRESCRVAVNALASPSLVRLDTADFLNSAVGDGGASPAIYSHLTRLTSLRVNIINVPDAVDALPCLQRLHVLWPFVSPAPVRLQLSTLCQMSTCLTRLVVEGYTFPSASDSLGSCLKELEFLDCDAVPVFFAPTTALSKLCLRTNRNTNTTSRDLATTVSAFSRTLEALELKGWMPPDLLFCYGVECPQLRTLKLAPQSGYIGHFRDCFEGLPALRDLVLEISELYSDDLDARELAGLAARGCHTQLVLVVGQDEDSDDRDTMDSDERAEDEAWFEEEADQWAANGGMDEGTW